MMDPILEAFAKVVASTPRSAPTLPWISSLTGDWITHEQSQDSAYWVDQIRRPVLFAKGIARLLEDPARRDARGRAGTAADGPDEALLPRSSSRRRRRSKEKKARHRCFSPRGSSGSPVPPSTGAPSIRTAGGAAFRFRRILSSASATGWIAPPENRSRAVPTPLSTTIVTRMRCQSQATRPTHPQPGDETPWSTAYEACSAICPGMDAASIDTGAAFLELGLDSLVLTQAALLLQKTFDVKISFRELLEELSTIDALAARLDGVLPAEAAPVPAATPAATAMRAGPAAAESSSEGASGGTVEKLIAEQLEVMRQQLEMLRGGAAVAPVADARPAVRPAVFVAPRPRRRPAAEPAAAEAAPVTGFGPYRPPAKAPAGGLTTQQEQAVDALVERYTRRTAGSKASTAAHRSHLADPRVRRRVPPRLEGARLPDRDRPLLRLAAVGHRRQRVRRPHQRLRDDPVRAQPRLRARGVARHSSSRASRSARRRRSPARSPPRVAAMAGMERVAFCNTGSEAVTAADTRSPARSPAATESRCSPAPTTASSTRSSFAPAGDRVDAHRPGHPDEHARQRPRPRLREPDRARLLEGPRRRARGRPGRAGAEPPSRATAARVPPATCAA